MNRIALALIACAGLGYLAGQKPATSEDVAVVPVAQNVKTIEASSTPVETPLVEKLIPKPVQVPEKRTTISDGQLSPRGEWRWSQSQGAWVPVAKAGPRWVENGHSATIDHLIREHGYSRASLERLTQAQLDQLHSNAHNLARKSIVNQDSPCPGGRCPAPSYSRGLFGRRR